MNLKSVTVLKATVILCMILVITAASTAPLILEWYAGIHGVTAEARTAILICYYVCAVPAFAALYSMLKLLQSISKMHPFEESNVRYINLISWCCIAVALACGIGGFWYISLFLVSIAMLFIFLVVRVVCCCYISAIRLQEDSDLTV